MDNVFLGGTKKKLLKNSKNNYKIYKNIIIIKLNTKKMKLEKMKNINKHMR